MEYMDLVKEIGFPIFVAGYLLIRVDKTIEKLSVLTEKVILTLDSMCEKCER